MLFMYNNCCLCTTKRTTVEISGKDDQFCNEFIKGNTVEGAYCNTFDEHVYLDDDQLKRKAKKFFKRKVIQDRIKELKDHVARVAIYDAVAVVQDWMDIADADVNELIQYQRNNCRFCYGKNYKFQWVNEDEFAEELAKSIDRNEKIEQVRRSFTSKQKIADLAESMVNLPTCEGGFGFVKNTLPNKQCPKCHGEGVGRVFLNDTRFLSTGAKKLYYGLKKGKDGQIEMKLRDKDAALSNLAKYFKVLTPEQDQNDKNLTIKIIGGLPE